MTRNTELHSTGKHRLHTPQRAFAHSHVSMGVMIHFGGNDCGFVSGRQDEGRGAQVGRDFGFRYRNRHQRNDLARLRRMAT